MFKKQKIEYIYGYLYGFKSAKNELLMFDLDISDNKLLNAHYEIVADLGFDKENFPSPRFTRYYDLGVLDGIEDFANYYVRGKSEINSRLLR